MKPTFLLLIALAIAPPLMAKKATHPPQQDAEMKAESDAIDFKVAGSGGVVKNYHLEKHRTFPSRFLNRRRPWRLLIGRQVFTVPQL